MSSFLVDFYNLHLTKFGLDVEERIIDFFKVYVPNIVRQLTEEEKQKVREYSTSMKKPSELIKRISEKGFAGMLTLDGYEIIYGTSWILSNHYSIFFETYQHTKKLIDEYLNGYISANSLKWLEEFQKNHFLKPFFVKRDLSTFYITEYFDMIDQSQIRLDDYSISLHGASINSQENSIINLIDLFYNVHTEIILMLHEKKNIKKCARNGCNNIFLKSGKGSGKQKYCSECSWSKNKKEEKKEVYRKICYLIDKWMGREDSRCAKANELTNYLKKIAEREGITDIPFLKDNYNRTKSLGQYLRYIKKMLEDEYRIKCRKEKEGGEHTYYFTRIQL